MNKKMTACFNLLDECFPGLKATIDACEPLGFPWPSKTFFIEENGLFLSHVGCLDYPLWIDGQKVKASAFHAICTKSTHRGQGLASKLIKEALEWTKESYDLALLYTEIPKFYEPFGFRYIQEYRFYIPCRHAKGSLPLHALTYPSDNAFFQHLFQERTALSYHVWVEDRGTISSYNSLFATYPTYWSLHYSPSVDALLSFEIKDNSLHLYDIIARKTPSLEMVLDHLPSAIEKIYFYFSPHLLTQEAIAEPYIYHQSHLMVQGNWPNPKPFMIPLLSRC